MKRRNADCGKLRRPIKRNKITESMYGSTTVLYMKFLVLWAIVITADFMFMFRFEFLWPFWLLLRSVHDSFKYKGLAFSVLFVCIAITSDLVCLFFVPVHWLLFVASTYVWVQYVWHTDKGICLPTIILWMLFVYLEAGIRWKDSRHIPHLDLCRPFAAHCIGYPVVTLGFGFKSYVGYRMRQRKQREVAKENEFYMQLLQQALPQEEHPSSTEECANAIAATAVTSNNLAVTITAANGTQNNATQNHHHNFAGSNSNVLTASAALLTHTQIGNSIATANGGTLIQQQQAQNHHHQHQQQEQHHHNHNNGVASSSSNTLPSSTSSTIASASATATAITRTTTNATLNCTLTSFNNDDKSYVQIGGGGSSNSIGEDSHTKSSRKPFCAATTFGINSNAATSSHPEFDDIVAIEPVEKSKGRRNRSKKENASKDTHHHATNNNNNHNNGNSNNNNTQHNNSNSIHNTSSNKDHHISQTSNHHPHHQHQIHHNNNHQHHYSDASSVSSASSATSTTSHSSSSANSGNSATSTITHLASKVVAKICESCLKLEADVKKYRSEILHMKQIENELRQKLDNNLTTKSCLLAKQKECDELEKRIHELTNARHGDMLQLQTFERRLQEERRQKQSLDAQLNNEKKARKIAEEKAARPECSTMCKQRRQQMDEDIKQLRRDLKIAEEAKQLAEQHGRKWEQELRMFEAEIRNRDSIQPGTDVLMNALAAMQDKNSTLEKNLSAETRVKLDLFSALGDAKRQLEISESLRRSKEDEIHDLKAKIAQLLAVMPTDSLCLPACSSTGASSMLRMNDTPPLQSGQGPASPMLTSLQSAAQQQQLSSRVAPTSGAEYVQQTITSEYVTNQQQQQQQCAGVVPVSVATSVLVSGTQVTNGVGNTNASNLDPNATVYTPKGGQNNNSGSSVVVGGASD
ncbi:hypothetical protein GQX74_010733 [Glossina fuscipes]|nr:hypothetical protein GQX74_010733 [Glossina fuscipes]